MRTLIAEFAALFAPGRPEGGTSRRALLLLLAVISIGAVVRFWGLGAVGLHGDEKTMALPTQHLVEHGSPLMPSGMFYPRAIAQVYLMAASVEAFGETEWAMRVPSALCGVLLIVLAWFVGRRFLAPAWNLAFVAAIALLPQFIVDAQTARMYVFLVTSIAGFLLLLFEWERTDRLIYLLGAVLVLLVGLQFHTLAVFCAPLLLYPGLLRGDLRKVVAGGLAFAIAAAGFFIIDTWVTSHYPAPEQVEGFGMLPQGPKAGSALPAMAPTWIAMALVAAAGFAAFVVRPLRHRVALGAGALLVIGLVAAAFFLWHLGALFLLAGLVVAQRSGQLPAGRVVALIGICSALALVQIGFVLAQGNSLRQTLGALAGWPSIWPYLVSTGYSIAAGVLVTIALLRALWCVAHRQRVPDLVLFILLGVWLPLFLIGFFKWHIPLRYVAGQALPLVLGAFAAAQWLVGLRWRALEPLRAPHAAALTSAACCLLVVDPVLVARTVNPGYASHPDHKGAAEFVRALELGSRDIIIAEDALQQTYYLGHIDYKLTAAYDAALFVRNIDGEAREFYAHVPVIGTGAELAALLDDPNRGSVYVIGSGEQQQDGRRYARGLGIQEVLDSSRFEVVYRGRDGLTQVWRARPPSLAVQN